MSASSAGPDNLTPPPDLFVPKDVGGFAYFIMLFQGLANLFPWNTFITASVYFASRFCNTPFANSFEAYFSFFATAFQTLGLALSVVYQERFSLHSRIIYPLLVYSVIFSITTMLVLAADFNGEPLFWVMLLAITLSGICGAFLSGGLFSMSAVFPPSYTAALMTGQALAGVVVSASDLLTSLAGAQPDTFCDSTTTTSTPTPICEYKVSYSALVYFLIATFVLLLAAGLQYVLMRLPFTEHHMRRVGWDWRSSHLSERISSMAFSPVHGSEHGALNDPLLNEGGKNDDWSRGSRSLISDAVDTSPDRKSLPALATDITAPRSENSRRLDSRLDTLCELGDVERSTAISFHSSRLRRDPSMERQDSELQASLEAGGVTFTTIFRVLRVIAYPAFAAMFTFVVTLSVFPSLTVFLRSQYQCQSPSRFHNDLYVPQFFLLYNLGDFSGRIVAGKFQVLKAGTVVYAALARVVFIPLFLLCNNANSQLPIVFVSDMWPICFMIAMAFTNGYVASSSMMLGPSLVDSPDKNLAGTIMIFCLTLGLMLGSVMSFSVVDISQGRIS